MSAILARRYSPIAFALISALLIVVGVLYFFAGDTDEEEKTYWPPLTMIYDIDGLCIMARRSGRLTDWSIARHQTGQTR